MGVQVLHFFRHNFTGDFDARNILTGFNRTGKNAADGCYTTVVVITQVGYQHLERRFKVHFGGRDVSKNGIEKRLQIRSKFLGIAGLLGDCIGIDHREVSLFFIGAQFDKEVKRGI